MTKPTKTPPPKPQPFTAHYLETLARSLVKRGLCSTNILEAHRTGRHGQ